MALFRDWIRELKLLQEIRPGLEDEGPAASRHDLGRILEGELGRLDFDRLLNRGTLDIVGLLQCHVRFVIKLMT